MLKNDLFDIEIVTDNDMIEIECDGKSAINSFKYPYNYILDS